MKYLPEYTLHDQVHLERVLEIMSRLLPKKTLSGLEPLELAALILSAGLHDVGMVPSKDEASSLWQVCEGEASDEHSSRYRAFRESYSSLLEHQQELRTRGHISQASEVEAFLLSEYIRQTHAERTRTFIFDRYGHDLKYEHFDFAARLASVCYSHTQDACTLDALPCRELVRSPGEYCNWGFVAIVLRLADILDFDPKRTPPILFENLGIRSGISLTEWKKHLSVSAWDIRPGRIAFTAQCEDPVIEKGTRDFLARIGEELVEAYAVLRGMYDENFPEIQERYALALPVAVDSRNVGPAVGRDGPLYEYVDLSFQLDAGRIMVLLMGVSLYADEGSVPSRAASKCSRRLSTPSCDSSTKARAGTLRPSRNTAAPF